MIEITHKSEGNGSIIFEAVCAEENLGSCECRFDSGNIVVEQLSGSGAVADALIRAALNYALQNGVDTASFALSEKECRALTESGLKISPQRGVESIAAFFAAKKCGC